MNYTKKLLAMMLLGCIAIPGHAAKRAYTATVTNNKVVKEKTFTCTDSVYVFVEENATVGELKTATVRWTDPAGNVVRTQQRNFIATGNSGAYLWDGLEFSAGGGFFSNIGMSFLDPSAGLEDVVGNWGLDIDMPGQESFSLGFKVMC